MANMKTLKGVLTGMFENDKSDAITLDRTTKITLNKGDGPKLLKFKNKSVIVEASEKEYNGKIVYMSSANAVQLDGDQSAAPAVTTSGKSFNKVRQFSGGYNGDDRQNSIVFQSMAKVAAELCTYNASTSGRAVTMEEILSWTYGLARIALKPDEAALGLTNQQQGEGTKEVI